MGVWPPAVVLVAKANPEPCVPMSSETTSERGASCTPECMMMGCSESEPVKNLGPGMAPHVTEAGTGLMNTGTMQRRLTMPIGTPGNRSRVSRHRLRPWPACIALLVTHSGPVKAEL
ncbi:hypothetical protein HaLaN_14073 [Haematococcus lacustris]|uniref:Uncharacterized protein n=1 Tax=Haematococcus lacustris TaxID=44745 RepID=A0A699Z778_HAELA|nr:hypothetical protein HaLaN_14073 [Haematococcus lacustris]